MDSYIEYDLKEKNRISENTLRFIDEQMHILEDSLRVVERAMLPISKVDNKLLSVDSGVWWCIGKYPKFGRD